MRTTCTGLLTVFVAAIFASLLGGCSQQTYVRDAYTYGYPLVTMDMTRRQMTNVAVPDEAHAPMGQLVKMREYPAVDNHMAAAPNADTMYTMVWLDVAKEPWVFSIPDMGDRFYIMPMLSGFNEVFFVAGQRTTGGKAQKYLITNPGWHGSVPPGLKQVVSPTGIVWICGRIYCTGTPEDYKAVHEVQDQYACVPFSAYGTNYTPPTGHVDEKFDMKTAVRKQVNSMSLEEYFKYLAQLLKANPPKPQDAAIVKKMAKIGIVPGQDFDSSKLPLLGRNLDPKLALLAMVEEMKDKKTVNGWLYWTSDAGTYGTDYEQRAMVTLIGPGLNFPQDAVYPFTLKDQHGDKYDGAHKYIIHFDKGMLPPVKGFWSITMYDPDFFFVANPIDRYNLSQRNTFVTNSDGSVDMYLQAQSPGKDKEANWLPAPAEGNFIVMLRLYWPKASPPSILDGTWTPPAIKRVDK